MMRFSVTAGLMMLLAGCATTPSTAPLALKPLPPRTGGATLFGHGTYRLPTGANGSCAGFSVALMADTPRSRDRMRTLYESVTRATAPISLIKRRAAKLAGAGDGDIPRSAQCDPHGAFTFADLPAGGYFMIARVRVSPPLDGERDVVVMRAIELRPGEARDVALAP